MAACQLFLFVKHNDASGHIPRYHIFKRFIDLLQRYSLGDQLVQMELIIQIEIHQSGHINPESIRSHG